MAVIEMRTGNPGTSVPHLVRERRQYCRRSRPAPGFIVHAYSVDRLLTWSYTNGLLESFGHPEFLLTGLDPFLAESVLSQLIERVSQGHTYSEEDLEQNLLHRLTCAFRKVPAGIASILMPLVRNRFEGDTIRTLQCIYPDNHNRLPWHFGYNTSWHEVQPLFTSVLPLTRVEENLLRAAAEVGRPPVQLMEHTL